MIAPTAMAILAATAAAVDIAAPAQTGATPLTREAAVTPPAGAPPPQELGQIDGLSFDGPEAGIDTGFCRYAGVDAGPRVTGRHPMTSPDGSTTPRTHFNAAHHTYNHLDAHHTVTATRTTDGNMGEKYEHSGGRTAEQTHDASGTLVHHKVANPDGSDLEANTIADDGAGGDGGHIALT